MPGQGIDGYLSRDHEGRYIFSAWPPEVKLLGATRKKVLHQAERKGRVDPWWFGLSKPMCEASLAAQGIELEELETRAFTWIMKPRGEEV
jgi:hypothetical protein